MLIPYGLDEALRELAHEMGWELALPPETTQVQLPRVPQELTQVRLPRVPPSGTRDTGRP